MKTRTSLVSNSSSSSFICLISEEIHKLILDSVNDGLPDLTDIARKFLDQHAKKIRRFGQNLRSFTHNTGESFVDERDEFRSLLITIIGQEEVKRIDDELDVMDTIYEWLSSYHTMVNKFEKKNPTLVFTHRVDC